MGAVKYTLLGKDLVFTKEMDLFNSLRKKYLLLSVEARNEAEKLYDQNVDSYSAYVDICKTIMDKLFEDYLQIGVLDIIKYGIYDIDEQVLRQEFVEECKSKYGHALEEFIGEIRRIDMEQIALDQERQEMIDNAGPLSGGYVSMSGNMISDMGNIIGNQIETAAINAVFAGGTALITGAIRKSERKAAELEKNTLFERNGTKLDLLEGMERDVFMLHHTIARLINDRTSVEYYYYAKEDDISRFEPVCRNILRGNFKGEEMPELERTQIHNVIMMNPYELRMYCYIMKEAGLISDELKVLMEYLCVDKESLADSYLNNKYDISDYTTYEAMVEFEKIVLVELAEFDVVECNFSQAVASKKEKLYIERRTFNQFIYNTIEDRDAAEKQYYEFIGEGFEEYELDELLEKYEETYDESLYEKNREDIRGILVRLIEIKVDDFKDTESLSIYVSYGQTKMSEHNLEEWDVMSIFEKKYNKLNRKEKFNEGVAVAKEKLTSVAGTAMDRGKELMDKIPFGQKKTEDSKDGNESATVGEKKKFSFNPFEAKKGTENAQKEVAPKEDVPKEDVPKETVETKNCPQCNGAVKLTSKFCTKCGYRF